MGWLEMIVMQRLMKMEIDVLASQLCLGRRWIPRESSPYRSLPEVRFSAIFGCSVCRLPNPMPRGETILGGGVGANYTAGTIRPKKFLPPYSWLLNLLCPPINSGFLLVLLI